MVPFSISSGVAVASSVFTITAMSVDRYLAITQSLRQPWMPSRRGACSLLAGLWLVALAIFAPLLAVATVEREYVPSLSRTRNGSVSSFLSYIFSPQILSYDSSKPILSLIKNRHYLKLQIDILKHLYGSLF